MFYKYAHNSAPTGYPDMILNAFDMKIHDRNEGMPPGACRTPKSETKNNVQDMSLKKLRKGNVQNMDPQKVKKNNVQKAGPPPASPPERGVRGAAVPREDKKGVFLFYPVWFLSSPVWI